MTGQVDDLRKRNQSAVQLLHEVREGCFRYVFSAPGALTEGRWKAMFTVPTYSKLIIAILLTKRIALKFVVEVSTLYVLATLSWLLSNHS